MNFTLLTRDQIWGDKALAVIKMYGTQVVPTDLSVILGTVMTNESNPDGRLTCPVWTASHNGEVLVSCVDNDGREEGLMPHFREMGIRPVIPSECAKNLPKEFIKEIEKGVYTCEYGEYPQTALDRGLSAQFDCLLMSGEMKETGKKYTFDAATRHQHATDFMPYEFPEYAFNGGKFIRIFARPVNENSRFSSGEEVKPDTRHWVQVRPVEWLMDSTGCLIAKNCLLSGIQFNHSELYTCRFEDTFAKRYLDNYFAKEIEASPRVVFRGKLKGTPSLENTRE